MKQKIYIAILIIIICVIPVNVFGYFATKDEHINSMSFGSKTSQNNIKQEKISPPLNLIQINDENIGNNVSGTAVNNNTTINNNNNNNNLSGAKSVVLNYISSNYYFFWSVVFLVAIIPIVFFAFYTKRGKKKY
ncbi:MAG: hypothetical protein NT094_04325 [Candidatus Staskawiczbacteria bacterium]|nr:hypothetical protein [Candidatus Staskawiczbacteria bacterium]